MPVVMELTALVVVQMSRRHQEHYPYKALVHLEVVAVVGPVKKKETVMMISQV